MIILTVQTEKISHISSQNVSQVFTQHSTPKAKALILSRLFRELEIVKFPNFGHFHVTDSEQNVLKTVSCLFRTSIPHAWFIKSCFMGSTTSTITIRFQIDFAPCVGWHSIMASTYFAAIRSLWLLYL